MLPPNLKSISNQISAKDVSRRTAGETALLTELNELDRTLEITSVKDSVTKYSNFSDKRSVGSGAGNCSCCGR